MELLDATLPTFGRTRVFLHSESSRVFDFFGGRLEQNRLDRIPHLGVAARVFTGVSHTRLEYTLLQCANVQLSAKIHRDDADVSLSNKVFLDGRKAPISSGEELLKSWILLSSAGHTQWTYGTERSMLILANQDEEFRNELIGRIPLPDLKRALAKVIDEFNDRRFHYVIAARRILDAEPFDRRKSLLFQCLRNLLVPIDLLHKADTEKQYKLGRLRKLYERIRLLSMISIDSHYSHTPMKLQLLSAMSDSTGLVATIGRDNEYATQLNTLAGWIADSLCLHPSVTLYQKAYEIKGVRGLRKQLGGSTRPPIPFKQVLQNMLTAGLGEPRSFNLVHLLRMSFRPARQQLLGGEQTNLARVKLLERELSVTNESAVAVDTNWHSGYVHVDLFFKRGSSPGKIRALVVNSMRWVFRQVDAGVLRTLREILGPGPARDEAINRNRARQMARQIDRGYETLAEVFDAVLRYVIPENWNLKLMSHLTTTKGSLPLCYKYAYEGMSGSNESRLNHALATAVTHERRIEIEATKNVYQSSNGLIVFGCFEKMLLCDSHGRSKDEWDGLIVALHADSIEVKIVEAKSTGSFAANEAFKQLKRTVEIIRARHQLKYKRERLPGLGAKLTFKF